MDRRERMRRAHAYEEMDRPAVYVRTGFPRDDATYDRMKAYLKEKSELKGGWSTSACQTTSAPVETRVEPVSNDWERHIRTMHTPKGDLESSALISLRGQPGLHETYYIKSPEDVGTYLSLPMPELGGNADAFAEAVERMGDTGIVATSLGMNPAGSAAILCGSETFAIMSITDRDVLHALCARERDVILARLKYALAQGVGPYFAWGGQEYLAPPLHGPKDFNDFNVKYDKPIVDVVHEAGGYVHVHCHGSVKKVFQGFLDMGADVLHPFEAPPMGDITPAEAKAMARGKLCLEGNLQIGDMYDRTPDEIREQTEALIRAAFDDRSGLIVCPTASPYIRGAGDVCYERCVAMVEAVLACAT